MPKSLYVRPSHFLSVERVRWFRTGEKERRSLEFHLLSPGISSIVSPRFVRSVSLLQRIEAVLVLLCWPIILPLLTAMPQRPLAMKRQFSRRLSRRSDGPATKKYVSWRHFKREFSSRWRRTPTTRKLMKTTKMRHRWTIWSIELSSKKSSDAKKPRVND